MAPEAGDRELGCIRTCRSSSSLSSSSSSSHPIPCHPIPFQPISSHPMLSHPCPSHPLTSHHITSHPIPFHPIPSQPIPPSSLGPSSEKWPIFWKVFGTRLCKEIIYYFAQKRSFLQRRKSVRKRSCRVRGMRPHRGPTCVRILYRIFANTIEKKQKNMSFRQDFNME